MKIIVCLLMLTVVVCYAGFVPEVTSPPDHLKIIQSKKSTWIAGENFPGVSDAQLAELVRTPKEGLLKNVKITYADHDSKKQKIHIPDYFDARTCWKECSSIAKVPDQSACSGWATITVSLIEDRSCIASDANVCPLISAINLLSCCEECGDGCREGHVLLGLKYWKKSCIVTGGGYNSSEGCQNYPYPQCNTPTSDPTVRCPSKIYEAPKCEHKCDGCTSLIYKDTLNCGKSVYGIQAIERHIQAEILSNGPVAATMDVYCDFMYYKSGVYQHCYGSCFGRQAVKIIGWGVENGVKYWLCVNAWGTCWGDNGFFKILRGSNHCGIEAAVVAGLPNV